MLLLRDWRQALRTPHVYRVGNRSLRLQNYFISVFGLAFVLIFVTYVYWFISDSTLRTSTLQPCLVDLQRDYNATYPLTPPIRHGYGVSFRIGIISDLDTNSRNENKKNEWYSILKQGRLHWNAWNGDSIRVTWDSDALRLVSGLALNGRGMELSELVTYDGQLLTFDDRTGVVHRLIGDRVYPWLMFMDGNGKSTKGFKAEWASVKDRTLYVGSMGKEWTTSSGEYKHNDPMWIKVVSPNSATHSLDWTKNYKKLRQSLGIEFPGYMIHESGAWSEIRQKWFFLPRRCSKEAYNETTDEHMSCNVLLSTDKYFTSVKVTKLENFVPIRGFSSFKFLPGSQDSIIVALKTEEFQGKTATYITAFTVNGKILLPDEWIDGHKFEGFEFI